MTRGADDTLAHALRDLRSQCTVAATAEDVLDVVRELQPCSLTTIVRHLEARSHRWVRWELVVYIVDSLVDADQLVVRVVDGALFRYRAYALPSTHEGG